MSYTTDNFIAGVKRRGSIPTSQTRFTSADLLTLGDQEIDTYLLPKIKAARKSYYSVNFDQSISSSSSSYRIPTRAAGSALESVWVVDALGNQLEVLLVDETDVFDPTASPIGRPCYYFKGNNIVLVPMTPDGQVTLRFSIVMSPSSLALTSDCAQVSSIDSGTNTVTCGSVPSTWSTSNTLDIVRGNPGYECLAIDQTPSAVVTGTNGTIQFSSLPAGLSVGDWVSLAETAPVIQLPKQMQAILEQRVANTCLASLGLAKQLKVGQDALKEMEATFLLLTPRSQKELQKIVPRTGLLRRSSWP